MRVGGGRGNHQLAELPVSVDAGPVLRAQISVIAGGAIRSARDQQSNRIGMIFLGRRDERGLSRQYVTSIDARAFGDQ